MSKTASLEARPGTTIQLSSNEAVNMIQFADLYHIAMFGTQ